MAGVPDCDRWGADIARIDGIIESGVAARGRVVHGDGRANSVLSGLKVQVLPCPPRTVNHSVVKIERGVAGRGEEVTSGVTTDGEVASGVHTEETVGEVTLHSSREGGKVLVVLDQVGDVFILSPALRCGGRDVATQAAGIVSQASEFRIGGVVGENRRDWTEVHFPAIYSQY